MASKNKFSDFVKRINDTIEQSTSAEQMRILGEYAVNKVKVRTRLGKGVRENAAAAPYRFSAEAPLSAKYLKFRKKFVGLSPETSWRKQNLTLTGSMLDNLKLKAFRPNAISIGTTGFDRFGVSNERKTEWQEKQGRIYNRLSYPEIKDLRRQYMEKFSDLLKQENLL